MLYSMSSSKRGEVRFNCGRRKSPRAAAGTGVVTEYGDMVQTGYVLSNASMLQTYLDLMDPDQGPKETLDAFRSTSIGPSAFSIYMGFDCEPEELGIQETTNFITTTTDMDQTFARWKTLEQQGVACSPGYDVSDPDFRLRVLPGSLCHAPYGDPWYLVLPISITTPNTAMPKA
jgi:phytoene dehydrogenase-like protein